MAGKSRFMWRHNMVVKELADVVDMAMLWPNKGVRPGSLPQSLADSISEWLLL